MLISLLLEPGWGVEIRCRCGMEDFGRDIVSAATERVEKHATQCPERVEGSKLRALTAGEVLALGFAPRRWFTDSDLSALKTRRKRPVTREKVLRRLNTIVKGLEGATMVLRDNQPAVRAIENARLKISGVRDRCATVDFQPAIAQDLRELSTELRAADAPPVAAGDIHQAGQDLNTFLLSCPLVMDDEWRFRFVT
jgi:hypothetical protein